MQGQRSTIDTLPETLDFEFGSMPTDSSLDQLILLNNMHDSPEINVSDFVLSPGEEQQSESANGLLLDNVNTENGPSLMRSDSFPQDLNLIGDGVDDGQVNFGGSENVQMSNAGSGHLAEESEGRNVFSQEGRRLSCKRKVLEGNVGQSSGSGTANYYWPEEGSSSGSSGSYNPNSSRNIRSSSSMVSTPPENSSGNPMEELNPISGRGNFRLRLDSSNQEEFVPSNVFPTTSALGLNSLSTSPQGPPVAHVPALRRMPPSTRWSGGGSSRQLISGEREVGQPNESNSRNIPRMISEHPLFLPAPELRNEIVNNRRLIGESMNIAGNVASSSSSRTGPSSGSRSSSGPNRVAHRNSPQYSRRLSELVRRSLLSSVDSESGGQNSNFTFNPGSSLPLPPASIGGGNEGPNSRSALLLRRFAAASERRSRLASEVRNVLGLMRRNDGFRFEDVMLLDHSVFFGMADMQDQHRDMRLDVDNMSYEELLALEERIGNVSTGLSEEVVLNRLKQLKYFTDMSVGQTDQEPCCICQEEYIDGDDLGRLNCGHDFHKDCIKQWLMHKNLCPVCKMTGLIT